VKTYFAGQQLSVQVAVTPTAQPPSEIAPATVQQPGGATTVTTATTAPITATAAAFATLPTSTAVTSTIVTAPTISTNAVESSGSSTGIAVTGFSVPGSNPPGSTYLALSQSLHQLLLCTVKTC